MTIQYIKETIEWRSGFKFDCTSRERNRSYLRSLYYTLAREYTNNSLLAIAKTLWYTVSILIAIIYFYFVLQSPRRATASTVRLI